MFQPEFILNLYCPPFSGILAMLAMLCRDVISSRCDRPFKINLKINGGHSSGCMLHRLTMYRL